jgi:hypothetical protein
MMRKGGKTRVELYLYVSFPAFIAIEVLGATKATLIIGFYRYDIYYNWMAKRLNMVNRKGKAAKPDG